MEKDWVELTTVSSLAEAEIIRSLLSAYKIKCRFGPRFVYPLTVGKLAETKILVKSNDYPEARDLLSSQISGDKE
jgi:hypothetical protein